MRKLKVILLVMLLVVTAASVVSAENLDSDTAKVEAELKPWAEISFPEDSMINLAVDLSAEGELVRDPYNPYEEIKAIKESISVNVDSNAGMEVFFNYQDGGFDGGLLNKWVFYEIDSEVLEHPYNVFPTDEDYAGPISLDSGFYDFEISAMFNLEKARDENWWDLEPGTYDDVVLEITIKAD